MREFCDILRPSAEIMEPRNDNACQAADGTHARKRATAQRNTANRPWPSRAPSTASLPYVAVARGHLIQAQVHAADGNAGLIAASILQRLPRGAAHSFAYDDGHTFHFSGDAAAGGVVFLCAEKGLGAGPAFAFLERCRRRYEQTQSEALPLKSFLKRFEGELAELRSAAEADGGDGAGLEQIEGKLQGIKQVMKESVEKVLDRGERIELLIDRTDHLQHNAFRFAQGSTALKRSLRWRSLRCYLMLGGAACFLAGAAHPGRLRLV